MDYLERGYFLAYGRSKSIVIDIARVFCCRDFKDLCFRWGIEHITTHYPQASLAERTKRNLKSALKIFHHETQNLWDEDLLWLSLAFNIAVHDSTRRTPDLLFWAREMKCPLGVRWDLTPVNNANGNSTNHSFWTEAYRNLQIARKRVAQRYNQSRRPHRYYVGNLVRYQLKLSSSKAQNITAKLLLMWSVHVVIAKIIRPNVVLLANPDTGVIIRRANVSQLKPFVK